jgi:hypothetical protein
MAELKFDAPPLGDPSKCRVFIPCKTSRLDLSDLARFGSSIVHAMDRHTIYPDDIIEGDVLNSICARLDQLAFNPRRDYVALLGDALVSALVCATLGRYYQGITFLRYDGLSAGYWPFQVH